MTDTIPTAMKLSARFIGKYMRMAKQVGEDQNPCYSRQIGIVLVKVYPAGDSRVVGTGYNGPPRKTPHCDSREYLENIVWPQLTRDEQRHALTMLDAEPDPAMSEYWQDWFLDKAAGCGKCPRKLIGALSGERLELCSCEHGEKNAIANAAEDLHGCWAFCWCPLPCWDCCKLMINAGIQRTFCLTTPKDYSYGSRRLLEWAGMHVVERDEKWYLADHKQGVPTCPST